MKKTLVVLTASLLLLVWLTPYVIVRAEGEEEVFQFELPLSGTTGISAVKLKMTSEPGSGKTVATLYAGISFTIKGEKGDYFLIKCPTDKRNLWGYVEKKHTLVNLPDLIPSIVYWDSNSVASMFKSSGVALPGITEQRLYYVNFYNSRFDQDQFVMPVQYEFAKQIMLAQQQALAEGNSLKLYETYRPHDVQMNVSDTLSQLMTSNSDVYSGIASLGKGWFIATSYSNHQRGKAMDCSLVKVKSKEQRNVGYYTYTVVTDYSEYQMPTQMHELSTKAVTFQYGVNAKNWKSAPLSKGMSNSEGAQLLQKYCTSVGMTPLASEWWHFDSPISNSDCKGDFYITSCVSEKP